MEHTRRQPQLHSRVAWKKGSFHLLFFYKNSFLNSIKLTVHSSLPLLWLPSSFSFLFANPFKHNKPHPLSFVPSFFFRVHSCSLFSPFHCPSSFFSHSRANPFLLLSLAFITQTWRDFTWQPSSKKGHKRGAGLVAPNVWWLSMGWRAESTSCMCAASYQGLHLM